MGDDRTPDRLALHARAQRRAVVVSLVGTAALGALLWWLLIAVEGWADRTRPATCLATRCFCEAVRDGPLAQPANTVSSLAYVLVGLWAAAAFVGGRRPAGSAAAAVVGGRRPTGSAWAATSPVPAAPAQAGRALVPSLALVVALVGLSSAFFHATLTFLGQYLDVMSMYLLGALLVCGALVRMGALRPPAAVALFAGVAGALAVAQYVHPESRRLLFALVLVPGILLEMRPGTCGLPWRHPRRWPLWTGVGLLVVAYVLWVLDQRGVLCAPDSLLQGHAAWHALTALAALMLVLHYGATRGGAAPA